MKQEKQRLAMMSKISILVVIVLCICHVGCERWSVPDSGKVKKEWFVEESESVFEQLKKEQSDDGRKLLRGYVKALRSLQNGGDVDKKIMDGDSLLMMAVRRKKSDVVKRLVSLDYFADVNCRDSKGNTPLIIATDLGYAEIVGMLIGAGALLDATNEVGMTALMACAKNGNKEIAFKLVDAGVDLYVTDKKGRLYGDYALDNRHIEIINEISERIKK